MAAYFTKSAPTWVTLLDIVLMDATTTLVLANTPRTAIKPRVCAIVIAICLAAHLHWSYPAKTIGFSHMIPGLIWGRIPHLIDALLLTKAEYMYEMTWRLKMGKIAAIPDGTRNRVVWAWFTAWNCRWIGTRWEQDSKARVPAKKRGGPVQVTNGNSGKDSAEGAIRRRKFVIRRLQVAIACYLLLDFLGWTAVPPEVSEPLFRPEKQYIFRRTAEITAEELGVRAGGVLGYGIAASSALHMLHSLAAAVMVGLGINEPEEWPSMFGNISDAWSIRRLWGLTWHQQIRHSLVSLSDYITYNILRIPKPNKVLARYARVVIVFTLSGLLHVLVDCSLGIPLKESGSLNFFMIQALGIAIEDMAFVINRSKDEHLQRGPKSLQAKILRYIWTATFIVWSLPAMIYPSMRHMSPDKVRPVPVSIFELLLGDGPQSANRAITN